jgi:methionyl-tRNA formyltransferase
MRAGFVTCVSLGLACMEEIYAAGGRLEVAVTIPDERSRRKAGRVYLDEFCGRHGVELLKFPNVNDAACVAALRERRLDWLFIIGWSQIAREAVLGAPRLGVLGAHPTLLPEGRGRAAVPWAIIKGLPRTGVTLFQLDSGVDTGPIVAQQEIPLAPDEDAATLYAKVVAAHRALIRTVWPRLVAGTVRAVPQDDARATVWPERTPADGRITPATTVAEAERLVRATTRPYPGAFVVEPGRVVRIWKGAAGEPSLPAPPGTYRLRLADGVYDAHDFAFEAGDTP